MTTRERAIASLAFVLLALACWWSFTHALPFPTPPPID
jgi:hypothetical protein